MHGVAFCDVLEKTANHGCERVVCFSLFRTPDLVLLQRIIWEVGHYHGYGGFQLVVGIPRSGILYE